MLAVLDAVGAEQPALVSMLEGARWRCCSRPRIRSKVQALAMMTPQPRMVRGPGYEWAQSAEERDAMVAQSSSTGALDSPQNPWVANAGGRRGGARALARHPAPGDDAAAAAAAQAMVGKIDVRHVLPSIQCPALVLRRAGRHVHRRAPLALRRRAHPGRALVELPGDGPPWSATSRRRCDEIEQFLTGARRPIVSDRVLATVLFTDIVGSTERAARARRRALAVTARAP